MRYLLLKNEIVQLDEILHVEMKENAIEILYGIVAQDGIQGTKFYGHILDYSEVKNDVNEEKTKIEQDYEKLMKALINETCDLVEYNKLVSYKMILEDKISKQSDLLTKIKMIINGKELNKYGRIKKVFKENGF